MIFRTEPRKIDQCISKLAQIGTEISNVKTVLSEVKKNSMFSNYDYKEIRIFCRK